MAVDDLKTDNRAKPAKHSLIWDLPVRLFHWTLVVAIIAAFVTNWLGVAYFRYHVWCGYAVIVLVVFRLAWGLVGTRHARFWNFVRGPRATFGYVRDLLTGRARNFAGHNPLGALMVMLLLLALLVQSLSGLFANDEILNVGPLYAYVSNELSLRLTSLHRQLFYWLAGAAGIHVLAVLAHYLFKRENLVTAMITGRKFRAPSDTDEGIGAGRDWLALVLVVVIAAGLAWIVQHAPVAVSDIEY